MRIETRGVRPEGGAWLIRWTVTNDGDEPLEIVRALAPHGRFRGDERHVDLTVAVGAEAEVVLPIRVDGAAGEIENAFLILLARSGTTEWRILARLRVRRADGMPQPRTERIDVQEVGFSGRG